MNVLVDRLDIIQPPNTRDLFCKDAMKPGIDAVNVDCDRNEFACLHLDRARSYLDQGGRKARPTKRKYRQRSPGRSQVRAQYSGLFDRDFARFGLRLVVTREFLGVPLSRLADGLNDRILTTSFPPGTEPHNLVMNLLDCHNI
jgi:hypothetical protein